MASVPKPTRVRAWWAINRMYIRSVALGLAILLFPGGRPWRYEWEPWWIQLVFPWWFRLYNHLPHWLAIPIFLGAVFIPAWILWVRAEDYAWHCTKARGVAEVLVDAASADGPINDREYVATVQAAHEGMAERAVASLNEKETTWLDAAFRCVPSISQVFAACLVKSAMANAAKQGRSFGVLFGVATIGGDPEWALARQDTWGLLKVLFCDGDLTAEERAWLHDEIQSQGHGCWALLVFYDRTFAKREGLDHRGAMHFKPSAADHADTPVIRPRGPEAFICECWLCGTVANVEGEADRKSIRCEMCHALLGLSFDPTSLEPGSVKDAFSGEKRRASRGSRPCKGRRSKKLG